MDKEAIQEFIDEIKEKRKNKPGSTSLLTKARKNRDRKNRSAARARKRNR